MTSKRVLNEAIILRKTYINNEDIIVTLKKDETFVITVNNKTFNIPKNYPFVKPTIFINNISYYSFLQTNSKRILQLLGKNKIDCLCCSTILCKDNWSPAYTIEKLLKEIEIMNNVKRRVKYQICIEDILKKYNYSNFIFHYIINFLDC